MCLQCRQRARGNDAHLDRGLVENLDRLGLLGRGDLVPDRLVVFAKPKVPEGQGGQAGPEEGEHGVGDTGLPVSFAQEHNSLPRRPNWPHPKSWTARRSCSSKLRTASVAAVAVVAMVAAVVVAALDVQ